VVMARLVPARLDGEAAVLVVDLEDEFIVHCRQDAVGARQGSPEGVPAYAGHDGHAGSTGIAKDLAEPGRGCCAEHKAPNGFWR